MPVWHASISYPQHPTIGPLVTDKWTRQQKRDAVITLRAILGGVGGNREQTAWYPFALHMKRILTDDEVGGLDPAWCALPAFDEGGTPEQVRALLIERGLLRA